MSGFKKDDKVRFGRKGGEQTEGIVEKVNAKSLKIKSLESRGRDGRVSAGQVWRVHPSLCTLLERNGKPVTASDVIATAFPNTPLREGFTDGLPGDDKVVAEAMAKLTTKEILALGRHFRKGYINSRMF
ncbi:hypothetical protein C4565_08330 [Candidatus Parcubacteria bacterium]|nr:MAG: hypothetical protein C4565_08330 [Candidatus Parcubacteria bacterium]